MPIGGAAGRSQAAVGEWAVARQLARLAWANMAAEATSPGCRCARGYWAAGVGGRSAPAASLAPSCGGSASTSLEEYCTRGIRRSLSLSLCLLSFMMSVRCLRRRRRRRCRTRAHTRLRPCGRESGSTGMKVTHTQTRPRLFETRQHGVSFTRRISFFPLFP